MNTPKKLEKVEKKESTRVPWSFTRSLIGGLSPHQQTLHAHQFGKALCVGLGVLMLFLCYPHNSLAQDVFKMGIGDPIDSGAGEYGKEFKKIVEEKTNGKVTIELFPNCSLGDESEMLQNTRRGTLDMCVVGIGNAVPLVPGLGAYTLPYLLDTEEAVITATTGKLFDYFNTMSVKTGGLRILGHCYTNFRHLTNSKKPVTCLEDLQGIKLRVPNNKIFVATFQAWGANPVPMAWSETFTGLQQGVIDGQDNPYVVNHTMKFEEVQKYLTELHYQYSLQPLFIGERTWKKLDPALQEILASAGMEAQMHVLKWENEQSGLARKAMEEAGVTVSVLKDEEKWKKIAVEKIWPEYYEFIGGKSVIDMIQKELGR